MDTIEEKEKEAKMNTKEELILNIKEWIKMDTEITKLKADIKAKTNKKKQLNDSIVNIMKNYAIDCFDIYGGSLVYKQKKTRKTISPKFLLAQLEEYYSDQPEVAKELIKKVLDNREEVVKDEIKRKIDKIA